MLKFIFLILIVISATLIADIPDHFKLPGKKTTGHSMRNIDFIYTLNLDQRPEKFNHCLKELEPYGIFPFRFSAVNGWELTLEDINDVGLKFDPAMKAGIMGTSYLPDGNGEPYHDVIHIPDRVYFSHCMAKGPIGIVLSHLSILQDAYNSGYSTIWVMEDDIKVIRNPHLISEIIDKLDLLVGRKNWDILFTDRDTKNQKGEYIPCLGYAKKPNFTPFNVERFGKRESISSDLSKVGSRYGAYSMIVSRSGMKKILRFIKKYRIFLPYDLEFYLPNNINLYCVNEDIVSTLPNALSDNGRPNYLKIK